MSRMNRYRAATILLFAIAFTLAGTFAPILYASNVPQDQVMEVHSFTAQNTTTMADDHYICFDRTVHKPSTAETFTELYMINEDGSRIEIDSKTANDYLDGGDKTVVTSLDLPDRLIEGQYRYVFVANVELADGRVDRTFTFESEPFIISDDINATTRDEVVSNC